MSDLEDLLDSPTGDNYTVEELDIVGGMENRCLAESLIIRAAFQIRHGHTAHAGHYAAVTRPGAGAAYTPTSFAEQPLAPAATGYHVRSVNGTSLGGIMIVQVRLAEDEAGDELGRLEQWLRKDEDLRPVTVTAQHAPVASGDMGPVLEVLELVLEPQGLLTAVAASLGTWVGTRRRNVRVRVRSGDKEVEIDASRLEDPDDVASRILRELGGQ